MNNAHILGTERIGKLLVQYSIPAIIGMTITSLYNIIDSMFVARYSADALTAVSLAFPLQTWTEQRKYWETH